MTAVRIQADKREKVRRSEEEQRVQERLHRLREEAAASGRANAAVQLKWSDILERNLPQELAVELATQKQACAAILASKDSLLSFLAKEAKGKDEGYVQALQAQKEDVEALIQRMGTQFNELSSAFEAELAGMEAAFLQERAALAASNRKETEALFEARRNMEARFVEEKLAREEAYARELLDMQAADAENHAALKKKLETDVAVLEQQLEAMRFTYLLNTEKLEYNYRVLTERDSENKQTLAAQKQRLARLRAALTKVQGEYQATDGRFKARNAALTEEYTRITKQYRELQAKFRSFEAADALRFAEVGSMHEEEMKAMASRLVSADKAITEQLLGWAWVPPQAPGITNNTTGAGAGGGGAAGGDGFAGDQTAASAFGLGMGQQQQQQQNNYNDGGNNMGMMMGGEGGEGGAGGGGAMPVHPGCLRAMLRLLVQECAAFLIDSKTAATAASLQSQGQPEVAEALQADCTLRSLECHKQEDVNGLCVSLQAAIIGTVAGGGGGTNRYHEEEAARRLRLAPAEFSGGDDEEGGGEGFLGAGHGVGVGAGGGASHHQFGLDVLDPANGLPRVPPSFQLISFLKDWIAAKKGAAAAATSPGGTTKVTERRSSFSGSPGSPTSAAGGAGGDGGDGAPARNALEDEAHWQALADTIPQQKVRIWQALEKALVRYKTILLSREQIMNECNALEEENAKLQSNVRGYLDPGYHGLKVPPIHTLPASAFAVAAASASSSSSSAGSASAGAGGGSSSAGGGGVGSAGMRPGSTNRALFRPSAPSSAAAMGGGQHHHTSELAAGGSISGGGLLTIIPATPSPSRGGPRAR